MRESIGAAQTIEIPKVPPQRLLQVKYLRNLENHAPRVSATEPILCPRDISETWYQHKQSDDMECREARAATVRRILQIITKTELVDRKPLRAPASMELPPLQSTGAMRFPTLVPTWCSPRSMDCKGHQLVGSVGPLETSILLAGACALTNRNFCVSQC